MNIPELNCHFINDIVEYIAGFVSRKLVQALDCKICTSSLTSSISQSALLIRKNKGGLTKPSKDVIKICKSAELHFRQFQSYTDKTLAKYILASTRSVSSENLFANLNKHILGQDPVNNHRNLLIYLTLKEYFNIRIHHKRNVQSA